MLRNRFLGDVSSLMTYAPDDGTGAGASGGGAAAGGAGAGQAAAAAGPGAGQGSGSGAAAGTGQAAGAAGGASAGAAGAAGAAAGALAAGAVSDPTKVVSSPADWPSDWREKAAGEDKGFLNQLKRYTDPVAALNWVRTQSLKISAGELRPTLKADASPEEIAEYRKANAVPEKAEGYVKDMKLPNGIVTGEADKPLLDSFAAMAHAKHIPQETYNAMVGWFFEQQGRATADRSAADQDQRIASEQQLIQTMGADFKPNMAALASFWKGQPEGLVDIVLGARDSQGRVLGNMPEVTAWLAGLARELNPAATLLPAGGEQGAKGIDTRLREIEGLMYKDSPTPGKWGPGYTAAVREEYNRLLVAQERLAGRAA